MQTVLILLPIGVFLVAMIIVGLYISRSARAMRQQNFSKDYYVGSRSLGGFVFAMTLIATYVSVSTFVAAPGTSWGGGFSWGFFATIQCVTVFLIMGLMGKRLNLVARKTDSVTVVDLIRSRYQSIALGNVSGVIIVIFFVAFIVGQFVGGATIFSAATGLSYNVAMLIFMVAIVIFTFIGGFKAVAITDTICAVTMCVGLVTIFAVILIKGGGFEGLMASMASNPEIEDIRFFDFLGINPQFYISQWLVIGICTIGLPQSIVRCLSFKSTHELKRAMVFGTIIMGALVVFMAFAGTLIRGIYTTLPNPEGTTDQIMPTFIVEHLPAVLAGIAILGPLAATISTVSSLLIDSSGTIVKGIYQSHLERQKRNVDQKKISWIGRLVTVSCGIIPFIVALNPPSIILWILQFAFGGLETAFFWTILLGMFWRKANATGAMLCMVGGNILFILAYVTGFTIGSFHNVIIGVGSGLIFFLIGTAIGKPTDDNVLRIFFPHKYDDSPRIAEQAE